MNSLRIEWVIVNCPGSGLWSRSRKGENSLLSLSRAWLGRPLSHGYRGKTSRLIRGRLWVPSALKTEQGKRPRFPKGWLRPHRTRGHEDVSGRWSEN